MKTLPTLLATGLAVLLGLAAPAPAQELPPGHPPLEAQDAPAGDPHDHDHGAMPIDVRRTQPWSEHALDLAAGLPIQDGGRVKPLSTFADFTLLRINGKRSVRLDEDTKLSSIEWLLDALFYPDQARDYPVFLVENPEVLDAIGIQLAGKKVRDRYSLSELQPGLEKLSELAREYHQIDERQRTSLQQQIFTLFNNVWSFGDVFGAPESLAIVPPEGDSDEWHSIYEDSQGFTQETDALRALRGLVGSRDDMAAFEGQLATLQGPIVSRATQRGEYDKIGLERFYYRLKPVSNSLYLYVLAFLTAAFLWLKPRSKGLHRATIGLVSGGTVLLIFGIVLRCLIRSRPPVSTLYETVLFVVAAGSLTALGTEFINRQRIAISAAAVLGMVGMFIANGYEVLDKKDTMPALVAVLDTNFWLAIHVTCITAGYSAGMLAALLASVYLVAKALRLRRNDPGFYRNTGRMVYGITCFALIFSLVGTILGGIWANDSWGRFWGWDPKENGALLICISQIAILHGRMGGYLREHGVCMAAAFGGSIIAFSWWGVNLLGVGLHSYGFTSGIHQGLWTYYGIQWGIVGLGAVTALAERSDARAATAPASKRSGAPQAS